MVRNPACLAAQGGDLIDPTAVPCGTKNDLGAVGGEGGEAIIGGVVSRQHENVRFLAT